MEKEEYQESRLKEGENKLWLSLELDGSGQDILVTVFSDGRAVIYDPERKIYGLASLNTGELQLEFDAEMIEESLPYLNSIEIKQVLSFIGG
jgi:hypothetical protein